ncbi:MAG: alanine--tRNA ligase [Candidatus Riflebacteria bacterium]|nr:alanine--tRNA ligase [Candidatus Riflebacteria bacterium]
MKTNEIREKFLKYFGNHDHKVYKSASLIPTDDPTLLFTSAGMASFKAYFLGLKRDVSRAASCQKCFRTTDIENVGYTARHHTFFEMLGNFSFGDYFKKEAIAYAWEFSTKELNIPGDRIHISVFKDDDEAYDIWKNSMGVPSERIVKLGEKDNFWTIGVGPSGPCSELYVDLGEKVGCGKPDCGPGCDCPRFLEFWNLVFTQFNRAEDGTLTPLERKNIDTGAGLERVASILQGKTDNFESDAFTPIVNCVEKLTGHKFTESQQVKTAIKVVSDHARALAFAIADGGMPSNEGRGYVLRKILRRASRFAYSYLDQDKPFLHKIVPTVIEAMPSYPEVKENQAYITSLMIGEEEKFLQTLKSGSRILDDYIYDLKKKKDTVLPGEKAFMLHDTYGFPLDLTKEICMEQGLKVDEKGFEAELEKQKERGRANAVSAFVNFSAIDPANYTETQFTGYTDLAGEAKVLDAIKHEDGSAIVITDKTPFYAEAGGQAGDAGKITAGEAIFSVEKTEQAEGVYMHIGKWATEKTFAKGDKVTMQVDAQRRMDTKRNHTSTHLLHKALKEVLGDHVKQAGSYVGPDRLRFDFNHFKAVSDEQLEEIENKVNVEILKAEPVKTQVMNFDEAVASGAQALFGEKYGDTVRVVSVGTYSKELCGGTHLANSSEAGAFTIISESSIASGVRRIEALTGMAAIDELHKTRKREKEVAKVLDCDVPGIAKKAEKLLSSAKEQRKEIEELKQELLKAEVHKLNKFAKTQNNVTYISANMKDLSVKDMKSLADDYMSANNSTDLIFLASAADKANFVLKLSPKLVDKGLNAGKLVKEIAQFADGSGGGKPDYATAGGKSPEKLATAMTEGEKIIKSALDAI